MAETGKLDYKLDAPLVLVMHETISKEFKAAKKFIEKQILLLHQKLGALRAQDCTDKKAVQEQICLIRLEFEKVNSKYAELSVKEDELFEVMRKRIIHLQMIQDQEQNPNYIQEYFEKRLNMLIIDFLLRNDYLNTAKSFIKS